LLTGKARHQYQTRIRVLHLKHLKNSSNQEQLVKRATGRYYTGDLVGQRLALDTAHAYHRVHTSSKVIKIADPFGGDGRLIEWLIEAWYQSGLPDVQWDISVWDLDEMGFDAARARFKHLCKVYGAKCRVRFKVLDTFSEALRNPLCFDVLITNPPWELLKPDRRELESLSPTCKAQYISRLRAYDRWLNLHYPMSQPRRKFAGWGTNLSRVGLEASLSLVRHGGVIGAVLPASILADDQTIQLREHLFTKHSPISATYYPAEAKLYGPADVASIALTMVTCVEPTHSLDVSSYDVQSNCFVRSTIGLEREAMRRIGYVIPVSFGAELLGIAHDLAQRFPPWIDLESIAPSGLWAGREIDETDISRWLGPPSGDTPLFVKGRMIDRYLTRTHLLKFAVKKPGWAMPASIGARRIAWRDVSRPSQKRRMIATLIEPGTVAGNSIGVAYFRDTAEVPLLALLGIMNSTCFEFQLRAHLATGHVSLSSLRKVSVPSLEQLRKAVALSSLVRRALDACDDQAVEIDAYVACQIYGLTEDEYRAVLEGFTSFSDFERQTHLKSYCNWQKERAAAGTKGARRRATRRICATA
jgi:Alw26I/Eco31I/Esp3I family type II restriction m6 adenine DNA methyltransferase